MKEVDILFFELIRVAIGIQSKLSRLPEEDEWIKLYKMAEKQSLLGICFAGLQNLGANSDDGFAKIGMSEALYLNWMGMAVMIQQKNQIMDKQCVVLHNRLLKDGMRSCILKGQGLGLLYTKHLIGLRQTGDIDIWVDGGFEKVNSWAQRISPTNAINQHHIHLDIFDDTEVELHYYPFVLSNPFRNEILRSFFSELESSCFDNNNAVGFSVPTAEFNLVFLLIHIYHHLFTGGIGMRQLMDYYFVLCEVKDRGVSIEGVKKIIHGLGLERFASALMWVMGRVFGMPMNYMLWNPNEKDGLFFLNEIMLSGNFGHSDERVPKNMGYWKSFWYLNMYNLRLLRFDSWSWFWSPIMRLRGFLWRKINGYK